jgi:alpha-tubulin suppressor-like RCC1 family protein
MSAGPHPRTFDGPRGALWGALWLVLLGLLLAGPACSGSSKRASSGKQPSGAGDKKSPATPGPMGSPTPVAIAAGSGHTCVLRESGAVACWGANGKGQLGDGSAADRSEPVAVRGLHDAVELTLGRSHTCARRHAGIVVCWGSNERGQLGAGSEDSSSPQPIAVRGLRDAVSLASGDDHTCAVRAEGSVVCWGNNSDGQLGNLVRKSWNEPVQIRGLTDATAVAAGSRHSCALRSTGGAICWGANDKGQLGDGSRNGHDRPSAVADLSGLIGLAAAGSQTCAFTNMGVYCFGDLGFGETSPRPRKVAEGSQNDAIAEVELGPEHGCVRHHSGVARCWGQNRDGRLGDGSFESRSRPVPLALGPVADLALGQRHGCALQHGGKVSCWGDDAGGALGQGDANVGAGRDRGGIRRVLNLGDAVDLASGDGFSCAVRRSGEVLCWGRNDTAQLGDASSEPSRARPEPVAGLTDAVAIAAGPKQACAVRGSGEVLCWGANDAGQLGRPPGNPQTKLVRPTPVPKLNDATAVALGDEHGCALRRSGEVLCWGSDAEGQLGDGAGDRGGKVAQLADATAIRAGRAHTCALRRSGAIACWGANNQGQIGNSAGAAELKNPVQHPAGVTRVQDAAEIAAGPEHACARRRDGTVACWGRNDVGQLGSGTQSQVWTSRVPVKGLAGVATLDIGPTHACAITGGRIACWGDNTAGQGGFDGASSPIPRAGITGLEVASLALGRDHTCARLRSGEVACWGSNEYGQLGDGGRMISPRPLEVVGL